jgi:hypothetical protein
MRIDLAKKRHCYNSATVIYPILWILGWVYLIGSTLFFMYWIFNWAVTSGSSTFAAWGRNCALSFAQEIFLMDVLQIYILFVGSLQLILPRLAAIHKVLHSLAIRMKYKIDQDVLQDFRLVQYLSFACRASRSKELCRLKTSQLLLRVDDCDIDAYRQFPGYSSFAILIILVVAVPALAGMITEQLSEVIRSVSLPTLTCFYSSLSLQLSADFFNKIVLIIVIVTSYEIDRIVLQFFRKII